jgi:methionine synthase I (cobalamin-dependent)
MASRRPILYLGPECEASGILEQTGQGKAVEIDADRIANEIERNVDGAVAGGMDQSAIDTYERSDQARRMAEALARATTTSSVAGAAKANNALS